MNQPSHHHGTDKPARPKRDWRRIHHSRLFWVGIVLCMAAISTYVLSEDLSWHPHVHRAAE